MAKSSGLGDNFYIGGYNISGDVNSLGSISAAHAPLEVTGIDKSAMERIGGPRTGTMEFTTFFNKAASQEHAILKTLPTVDTQVMYMRGTTVGNAAAAMTAKQVNYDGTRAADGAFTFNVQALSNAYGLEWGINLSAGVATLTGAGGGTAIDTGGSLSFGGVVYYQVFSFSGTDAQIKISDSADNVSFATVTSFTSSTIGTSVTPPYAERIASTNTTTIRQYVKYAVTTSGGFSSLSFAVMFLKNPIAGQVY